MFTGPALNDVTPTRPTTSSVDAGRVDAKSRDLAYHEARSLRSRRSASAWSSPSSGRSPVAHATRAASSSSQSSHTTVSSVIISRALRSCTTPAPVATTASLASSALRSASSSRSRNVLLTVLTQVLRGRLADRRRQQVVSVDGARSRHGPRARAPAWSCPRRAARRTPAEPRSVRSSGRDVAPRFAT